MRASESSFQLSEFTGVGYSKGRSPLVQIAWFLVRPFIEFWAAPNAVRVAVLRAFGAQIGAGVLIRHNVRIHWPWKLSVGESSWIGERTWILNLEPVVIGANTCVSQEVLLCAGSHDRRSPDFRFDNAPVVIGDGAWIAARATVLRGVTIGSRAVVGAGSVVSRSIPDNVIWTPAESGAR